MVAPAYQIRITPRALADLTGVFDYVRQASPQNAATLVRTLMDAIDGLQTFPHRYNVPRDSRSSRRDIRSMPVGSYLVRYRIDERRSAVVVMRVRHGARRGP